MELWRFANRRSLFVWVDWCWLCAGGRIVARLLVSVDTKASDHNENFWFCEIVARIPVVLDNKEYSHGGYGTGGMSTGIVTLI